MAVPSYTEDLTDIDLAEATTNFTAIGGGGAGLSADVDFSIQGTYSITKQVTGAGVTKGMLADNGSTITMGANDHVFVWVYATCPGLLAALASGGMRVAIGTATSAYNDYYVAGNDTYSLGGHICWPIRYSTSTPSPGAQTGTPGANPQWFGGQLSVTGTLRAANLAIDASRYGTGAYITAGEVANPGTFDGFATQNDAVANRWGILGAISGGFILQGRFVIGQNNSQVATLALFDDSNVVVNFVDTPHSQTDFTQIIIDHASTIFNLTNITFNSLGTNNPGKFVYNNASTVSALIGCVFNNIGESILRAGVTATACTWRVTGQITQNGATFDGAFFENISAANSILSDDPSKISDCEFTSDGSNHALEITTPGTYSFAGNSFSGYASVDGSTGNEVIYNNSGGAVTINVSGNGTGTVSVRNGTSATTTVNNTKALTINIIDSAGNAITVATEITVVKDSDTSILYEVENVTTGSTVYNFDGGLAATVIYINALNVATYEPTTLAGITLPATDSTVTIQMADDRNYNNP